ncbi:uncharacterized protein L201_002473 [Kwoniella dendrophila CBS 6074]|uniref:ATP-binding cassette transporter YOR1 n=1 Tax=Kwoniella dendrophila CBS 6074 TaxID=1295534 RepID=A0AAX4JSZ5_9TREE
MSEKIEGNTPGPAVQGIGKLRDLSDSEVQQFPGLKRDHWWQLWRPRLSPPPPKASLEEADVIPLSHASLLSRLTFQWVTPIMVKGYQRPLQATDLWKMDSSREAQAQPYFRLRLSWFLQAVSHLSLPRDLATFGKVESTKLRYKALQAEWRQRSGKKRGSVTWALNDVMTGFWIGGIFKVASDVSQLMIPLLVKALINFSKEVCQHQFFFRSMAIGVLARATLICSIYQKAMGLSVGGRADHPNGKLLTYLSSDISRIDYCAQWFHAIWTAPIQLTITLVLLIIQIGPSALVGFSLFVILAPLQTWFMKLSFKVRKKSMKWTDSRSRLLRELLSSMEIIKVFTYEIPFLKRLKYFRMKEMLGVRKILVIRAANQALAFSVPALASVLSFVTYAATHDTLDPAVIFTSLAFFNLLRQPLMFLPRALSSLTDAQNAIERLTENATFSWDSDAKSASNRETKHGVFRLENINIEIPRGGQIIGIVGPVGSGKSSLLQGLIGEMSILHGSITFGGRLAYCQQSAWIQNASVRDNILFGQPWDEARYWDAIRNSSLMTDLELLPDGDLTEAGVNLSGGQKQRINIARALYYDADIVLFDDPLSAVDAHVGKALFENAILPLRACGKSVILVTHAIHFLSMVDRIHFMIGGKFVEEGTFNQLVKADGFAAKLFREFGGSNNESDEPDDHIPVLQAEMSTEATEKVVEKAVGKAAGTGKLEGRLMISETRKTGSVGRKVYAGYLHAARSNLTMPLTVLFAAIMQGSQVMATVWLTWWQEKKYNQSWNVYQGVYAALGVSQAIFTFAMGATLGIMANLASRNLHSSALENVFYSPKSMFDTQPLGRILVVFGKDIDSIDNQLPDSLRMMAMTLVTLIGSIAIITVFLHYFILMYFAMFYRSSSREVKRLDSMLRSLLYSHFSESLSGLATIRAYGETDRFIKENAYYMDLEDRAYLLSATNQRWLSIRLDFLGACLVFAVAIMSAKGGGGLTASQIALCLTYLTSITQVLGMVTRQSAEVENNMNAVERVLWYADAASLPQEAAHVVPATQPPESWPEEGAITFKDVFMAYRPGLPPVLKGLSTNIHRGEKIGIIGRTGAGKTSITVALYRLVDNLDPFDLYQDNILYDALWRSCVLTDRGDDKRLSLDSVIEEGGQNLSVGERSLISLARALVKNSKIVVLDEATAAVDLETDSKIQETIHREFKGRTLLCIVHRLRTIISWDRILVMNAGEIDARRVEEEDDTKS